MIWQNQKHDGRTYTKTSDDISKNRRNESLTSIVHAPLRFGRRTERRYVYKWYVVFGFDIIYTQRCWWGCILYCRDICARIHRTVALRMRVRMYVIRKYFGVGNICKWYFWRYILWTHRWLYVVITTKARYFLIQYFTKSALLVIIHIPRTQKWAARYYSPNPCFLIWQNQKHDGRSYTKTSDDISTNRRNESSTSIVHAPLRFGKRTERRYVYKWYGDWVLYFMNAPLVVCCYNNES